MTEEKEKTPAIQLSDSSYDAEDDESDFEEKHKEALEFVRKRN